MEDHPDELAIREMIERSKGMPEAVQRAVWDAMQLYRLQALFLVRLGENRIEREIFACLARGRFRARLEQILADEERPPASC